MDKNGQRVAYAQQPATSRKWPATDRGAGVRLGQPVHAVPSAGVDDAPGVHRRRRSTFTPACRPTIRPRYTSLKRDAHRPGVQPRLPAIHHRGDQGSRRRRAPTKTGLPGISLDDPDRDGYCEEISEGDLDMAEWYLLNHPAPTRGKITADVKAGEKLFTQDRLRDAATCPIGICCRPIRSAKDYTHASTATAASSI